MPLLNEQKSIKALPSSGKWAVVILTKIKHGFSKYLPARFWLAGPLALILSIVIMAASPLWLPHQQDHLYHMVFPVILFPLIWSICFFYPLLETSLKRATLVMSSMLVLNIALIVFSLFL